jgi:hypothetical protein
VLSQKTVGDTGACMRAVSEAFAGQKGGLAECKIIWIRYGTASSNRACSTASCDEHCRT